MATNLVSNLPKKAIVYMDSSYTYTQLLQHASIYASAIKGDHESAPKRAMLFMENSPNYVFGIFGAISLGTTTIPVDVLSTSKELGYMINDSRPEVVLTTEAHLELITSCIEKIEGYTPRIITTEQIDVTGVDQVEPREIPMPDMDHTLTIIYTSGTTGSPKGVMLSMQNLWCNMDVLCNSTSIFHESSRTILILPLNHIFGYCAMLVPMHAGAEMYMAENLAPDTIMRILQQGRITVFIAVPRLYESIAKGVMAKINANPIAKMMYWLCTAVGSQKLAKIIFKEVHQKLGGAMEYMASGGASLPIETAKVFKRLGFYILEGYGMTECAPMITFTRPGERVIGRCGRTVPNSEIRIDDNGEICVRGENVMQGYYNRPEETAHVIKDGWLHTGDTGIYHPKRGLKITGRIKEIIVTPNGKNINPVEIENMLSQSSALIKEAAVILRDDILQAIVYPDMNVARVETSASIEELVKKEIDLYNRTSMSYKRIMRFHIASQELPKNRLGKLQRYKLDERITERKAEQKREDISGRSDTFKSLKEFLDDQTGKYANGDSHFELDLALDSLGRISLISYIEDTFGVSISEEELADLSSLNLLSEHIELRSNETTLSDTKTTWKEILEASDPNIKLPHSGAIHHTMHTLIGGLFSLLYKFRVRGKENIPSRATIFVANHQSAFDGLLVTSKIGWDIVHRTLFFAKEKHFRSGWRRFFAKNDNIILMNINTNVRNSIQQMYQVLRQGRNIVIFPEGTRSINGKLQEFKESFAILSTELKVPVVPVVIDGSRNATTSMNLPKLGAPINVEFLKAVYPTEGQSSVEFRDQIAAIFAKHFKE